MNKEIREYLEKCKNYTEEHGYQIISFIIWIVLPQIAIMFLNGYLENKIQSNTTKETIEFCSTVLSFTSGFLAPIVFAFSVIVFILYKIYERDEDNDEEEEKNELE